MNKKSIIFPTIILIIIFSVWATFFRNKKNTPIPEPVTGQPEQIVGTEPAALPTKDNNLSKPAMAFLPPLSTAKERVKKKSFGLFVTPMNSPVQPENFSGYHTGTDFEIFSGEENADVSVKAVCSGNILMKKSATGYGGVLVESCELSGEPITIIYGHLKLTSINFNVGDKISAGDTLGILGRGYSTETSGERKHLHLGFHKGRTINILGYVQNKSELAGWLDPCQFVCTD